MSPKIMGLRKDLGSRLRPVQSGAPGPSLDRTQHEILIADDFGVHLAEQTVQQVLDFMLMRYEQIARSAISARIVQGNGDCPVDVN